MEVKRGSIHFTELTDVKSPAVSQPGEAVLFADSENGALALSINGLPYVDLSTGGAAAEPWIEVAGVIREVTLTDQVVIGVPGPLGDEQLRVSRAAAAAAFSSLGVLVENFLTAGAQAGTTTAIDAEVRLQGAATTSGIAANFAIALQESTGAFPPGGFVTGYAASVGAGDVPAAALGHIPEVSAFTSEPYIGVSASVSIDDLTGFEALSIPGTDATHTVTNARGALVRNQGALGITNAIGIDVLAQAGASGLNLGARFASPVAASDVQITVGAGTGHRLLVGPGSTAAVGVAGQAVVAYDQLRHDLLISREGAALAPLGLIAKTWIVDAAAPGPGTGSVNSPFPAISMALSVAAAGDTILVAPGAYAEVLTIPNVDNLCIRSIGGSNCTSITALAGPAHTITFAPPPLASIATFRLEGFRLVNGNAGFACLNLDGTATAVATICAMFTRGAVVKDCPMVKTGAGSAVILTNTGPVVFERGTPELGEASNACDIAGAVTLINAGLVYFFGMGLGLAGVTALSYTYDDTLPATPANGRQGVYLLGASACRGNLILNGTPLFVCNPDCSVFGTITTLTGLTTHLGPAHAPVIFLLGTLGLPTAPTTITLALPALALATIPVLDLSRATLYGSAVLSSAALGFVRNYVKAHQLRLEATSAGPGSITAGADTDVDLRGALFPQASLVVAGNGAIDRDGFTSAATVLAVLGTPIAITPPLPAANAVFYPAGAPYVVLTESTTPIAVGITLKVNTGFLATPTVIGTSTFRVARAA